MGGRFDRPIWFTAAAGLSCLLAACGGGGGGNGSGTGGGGAATVTSVSVTCTPTSVQTGQTSQCSASVSGTGNYSSAVTWSATGGTVSSGGVFTPSAAGTATITATSAQDSTKSGNATVTVTAPTKATPTVTAIPTPSSITTAQGLSVNVTVSGGTGNPAPTGSAILTGGGYTSATATLTNGYITFLIPAGSLAVGSDTLTVTYTPDSSSSATYNGATGTTSVTVTVASTITAVSVTCAGLNVGVNQTTQCSSTVTGTGTFSTSVAWSVSSTAGGSNTVGTVSNAGLYTAPSTVPTPYTVAVTATSTVDPTKSGSMNIVVAGTIASATQPITAAVGGTITLSDGSSVTIAPGVLTADNTVTLTEVSVPPKQPATQLLAAAGPGLYLNFASPPQFQSVPPLSSARAQSTSSQAAAAGITFSFNFGLNSSAISNAMSALATVYNQAGQVFYQAISSTENLAGKTATAVWDSTCTGIISGALSSTTGLVIGVNFWELATRPTDAPTQNLLVWNPTTSAFTPFALCQQHSPKRVLVVVHGMLSSVEGSYETMLQQSSLETSVPYGVVYGIDYDWWDGLQANGQMVAAYLDTIAACEQGSPIDILAHSEGVPVTLSALAQDEAAKVAVKDVIAVAGPILGTPIANTFTESLGSGRYALLTVAANWPQQEMVFPPATPGGILDLLQDQFATDLATDSSGSNELATIRQAWQTDPVLSEIPIIMAGGTSPKYPWLQWLCKNCLGIFTDTPFDGVVGLDSAFGAGLDLPLYRIPALPDFHTDLVNDTSLTGSQSPPILGSLALQLTTQQPPQMSITTSSPSALCHDSRSCSGPPGSLFTFTLSGVTNNSSALSIYVQDPTGTQDTPISVTALPDGTLTFSDPTPSSKANGAYGYWILDPSKGVSNSVTETICSANCPSPPAGASVEISPITVQLETGSQQQFTATETNLSSPGITWTVNELPGGDSTVGTVNSAGLYAAPAAVPNPAVVTVTAVSQAEATVSASATVTVVAGLSNPSPAISGLIPDTLPVNSPPQTMTINGSGFLPSSTVTFNGTGHTAAYVSANALTITLSAADLGTAGSFPVVVTNPAPGGGTSAAAIFTVTNPQIANEWTWINGSSTVGALGVYGTLGAPSANNVPGSRYGASSWIDSNGNLWLFGGYGYASTGSLDSLNDLWMFSPITGNWTWVSGSSTVSAPAVYGSQGVPATTNVPGARMYSISWIDKNNKLWLFGGEGVGSNNVSGFLDDLWEFDPVANAWTWVSGNSASDTPGVYGTLGQPSISNVPGSRYRSVSWIDSKGNLWLFGGDGEDSTGFYGQLNDLWEYSPSANTWTWVSGGNTANVDGVYGTEGIPATTNVPGSRRQAVKLDR